MNITKSSLEKLPIPKQVTPGKTVQNKYYDDKLKGFGVRVTSGGTKAFFVEKKIRHTNKVKRITIARYPELTVEQARQEAQKYIGKMVTGFDPSPTVERQKNAVAEHLKTLQATTLEQAFEDYLESKARLKPKTVEDYRSVMTYCLKDWFSTPLLEISEEVVVEMHARISDYSKARANYAMRVLRAVCNFAISYYKGADRKPIFTFNPAIALKGRWHHIERRQTVIKPYQLEAWFKAVIELDETAPTSKAEIVKDYVLLLIFTGLRRQEAAGLKWLDVDFHDRTIKVTETKNHKTHTLPCSDYLIEILNRCRERCRLESPNSPFVFPGSGANGYIVEPKKQMNRIIESSGVKFCIHDLRRSFATYANALEIPYVTIKTLLNHSMKDDVTKGYIVPDAEQLRKPMQMIADYILTNAGLKKASVVSLITNSVTIEKSKDFAV